MQKKFISNLALLVLLNLLVKPAAIFGIDIEIQNTVPTEEYGTYFSLLSFSFLFNILLDFGINNFTTKRVAQYPEMASKYLGKVFSFRFVLFIFYAVISFSIGLLLGWGAYEMYLLAFLVLNQFMITMIAFARSHFGGLLMFKTDAILSVLDRFLLIIFCGILLYTPVTNTPFQIEWFVYIQTICYGITLIIALALLFSKFGVPKLKYNSVFSYSVVKQSFPYALLIFLMTMYTRVDSVMLERMLENGDLEAGYYVKGFRLLDAFFMFAMLFSNLLFPIFARMLKKKEDVRPLLSTAAKLLIGGAVLMAIITWFNSKFILGLIYDKDIEESFVPFQLLMFSFIGMCATVVFGTLLTARGNLKFLNTLSAIGILVNVTANYFLIPQHGAAGAAMTTLVTQSIISIGQFIYCARLEKFPFSLVHTGLFVLYVATVFSMAWYFRADSVITFIGLIGASLIAMIAFRLIDLKNLRTLFKQED